MKRTALILMSIIILTAPAWATPDPAGPSAEIAVGAAVEIPGFALCAYAEYLSFPWPIDFGAGQGVRLGWGAMLGLAYSFDAAGLVFPLQAIFAARFDLIEGLPLDAKLRAGYWLTPSGSVIVGGLDLAAVLGDFRLGASLNVFPYGSLVTLSCIVQAGYAFSM